MAQMNVDQYLRILRSGQSDNPYTEQFPELAAPFGRLATAVADWVDAVRVHPEADYLDAIDVLADMVEFLPRPSITAHDAAALHALRDEDSVL